MVAIAAIGSFIIGALSAAVSAAILGQAIDQYSISEQAGEARPALVALAKQIASKISNNQTLLSRFQNYYNSKNTDLLNALYRGMGYGPRMESIIKMIEKNDHELDSKTKQIGDENTELSAEYEDVQNKMANLGTSHSGNEAAGLEPTGIKKITNAFSDALSMNQNIGGGITNGI